ncbi:MULTISPECIES: hypothetical protein [Halorussus]|uniref:hypothetical protein n=1 Tax=Halorussus TaxID=1070314 RepID=UPI000E2134E8|nr:MULTISPECIES: hypothetical protein [Halorussus]NHN60852.1 hypothetical protein [Halorussus sp. JP-T4]
MSDSSAPADEEPSDPSGRDWRRIGLVTGAAALVVVAVLAGGLWLYAEHLYRTSYESGYTYELAVNTNETLENVALYVPVPLGVDGADDPSLDAALVERGNAADDNFTYDVVETERGPMLRLRADRVAVAPRYYEYVEADGRGERVEIPAGEYDPANPNMTRDADAGTLLTVTVPADGAVETADPWSGEPLFRPRSARRPTACGFPAADWLRCYEYDSAVYASYEADETVRVDVVERVQGENAWWMFGWNYDTYRDGVEVALRGPQDGWTTVTGTVEVDVDPRDPPTGRAANASA